MDEAVLDVGLEDGADLGVESTDAPPEIAVDDAPVETEAETSTDDDQLADEEGPAIIDGKKLSPGRQKLINEIAATRPKLAREIRQALFQADALKRDFPEGFQQVAKIRQTFESLGGEDGVKTMQSELQSWGKFDENFTAGKPEAIDFMLESPEGKASFLKLVPHALNRYAELHPNGFTNYMTSVMSHDMAQARVPMMLELLEYHVGDNPRAMQELQKLKGYFNRIEGLANGKVEEPKFQAERPPDAGLDQREADIRRTEWRQQVAGDQSSVFNAQWTEKAAGRSLTTTQVETVKELYEIRMRQAITQYKPQLDRLFANKDQEGWKRLAAQINRTEIPKALRAAFDRIMPAKPGPKGTVPPKPGAPAPRPVGPKPGGGVTQVAKAPTSAEIDYTHPFNSGTGNYLKGQAILKDGRKVSWKR